MSSPFWYPFSCTGTIPPSGSSSAAINAAIQRAAAVGGVVNLIAGEYVLDSPVVMASNVTLRGLGAAVTVLSAGFLPAVGLADDPTNALVKVAGSVIGGGFSTTSTAILFRDGTVVGVTSTASMAPGDWVRIESTGSSTEGNGAEGALTVRRSLLRVLTVDSGIQFTSSIPSQLHHDVGSTVVEVSTVENVNVDGITIKAPGGTIASGIYVELARKTGLDGLHLEGFSRAAINLSTVDGYTVNNTFIVGECNSGILFDCAHHGTVNGLQCAPDGLRAHVNGIPRATFTFLNTSSGVIVENGILRNGFMGLALWACRNVQIRGIVIEDYFFSDALRTRHCSNGQNIAAAPLGIVMGSRTVVDYVSHNSGIFLEGIQVVDCSTDNASGFSYAFEIGDCKEIRIRNCQVRNRGPGGPTTPTGRVKGFYFIDNYSGSVAEDITVVGLTQGLTLASTGASPIFAIRGYNYDHTAGDGPIASPKPIVFEMSSPIGPDELSDFVITSSAQLSVVGSVYPTNNFTIRNYFCGGSVGHCDYVILAVNKTGAGVGLGGGVYEIDEAGAQAIPGLIQFKATTGVTAKAVVEVGGIGGDATADGDVMFVAPLPQRTKAFVRSEVAIHGPGGALETVVGSNLLAYSAAPTAPVGRLLAYHASGAFALRPIKAP